MKLLFNFLAFFLFPFTAFSQESEGWDSRINNFFAPISEGISSVVFYSIPISSEEVPIVLLVLLFGAVYFTFYFRLVNIRKFFVSINIIRGKYKNVETTKPVEENLVNVQVVDGDIPQTIRDESAQGEVSHFQALSAALSATVGLGNIAGVAIALTIGGPGATFWMIIAGILGMSSKFVECTLGVKYRDIGPDGTVYGGPMYYLSKGFAEKGWPTLGKIFGVFFAIMCVGGSLGGGNMFQSNQAAQQFLGTFNISGDSSGFIFGLFVMVLVGVVIIGGIKRIGKVAEKIVPFMAVLYVTAALIILFVKYEDVPAAFGLIISEAFNPTAITGGFIGVLIQGFRRAAFSNEAGVGSAAIAHSAVRTKFPASEGLVALLEPFIDTVVICTMTALVVIVTNVDGQFIQYGTSVGSDTSVGVAITSVAFDSTIPGFKYILTIAVVLFAFSTMLSWSYYGLQSWKYLFGRSKTADTLYKAMFCVFIVIGASASLGSVVDFSDAMVFAMVFPNIIGLLVLSPIVKEEIKKYLKAIKKLQLK